MYTYLFAVGTVIAFLDAYAIGANDVANSFATSVGSGTLTLRQACVIAFFTEFLGAILLGSDTAETVKGKILSVALYNNNPGLLQLTMVCALIGSSTWVLFATKMGWPVSTTHSIVGAIIGAGIAAFGTGAIIWDYSGVAKIVTSWFISPLLAGTFASIIFLLTKYLILNNRKKSFQRGLWAIPVYFGITFAVNIAFIVYKGAPGLKLDKLSSGEIAGIVVGVAVGMMLFCICFVIPWMKRRIINQEDMKWWMLPVSPFWPRQPTINVTMSDKVENVTASEREMEPSSTLGVMEDGKKSEMLKIDLEKKDIKDHAKDWIKKGFGFATKGVNKDVVSHAANHSESISKMHDYAEKFDPNTELLYSFLQVATACFASFAHGSNDVANAVAPYSVIYYVWVNNLVPGSNSPVPTWILAFGGISIDIGLITYGYNIMRSLGNNMTYHSPSRGFSMELGATFTVLLASKLGLPVSTTHCITGATAAVGLCNWNLHAVNWKMFAWCFFSWILTLPCAGLTAGLILAWTIYSPVKYDY